MEKKLYYLPVYYDIAFSYDITGELHFFTACFETYADIAVSRVLEPACGSGRLLLPLAERGYHVLGYDISEEMVAYTRDKIEQAGLNGRAEVVLGDMRTREFKETFDAALNLLNTIGYLLSDADILRHFKAVSHSLRRGGIYIVELACAPANPRTQEQPEDTWIAERDGITVRTTWHTERYDYARKRKYNICKMQVEDGNPAKKFMFIEPHILRLWFAEDVKRLSAACGFVLKAIYNQGFDRVPLDAPLTGELGNLYFVLKKE
jgi:SAM-dependent methyltransferase